MSSRPPAPTEELARAALACSAAQAPELLRSLGFRQPGAAMEVLDRLAGPRAGLVPLPPEVLAALARTADPDQGLRHLERFVEVTGFRTSLYARLTEFPLLADSLAQLLAFSRFLTDILVRNPEYLYWLLEDTPFLFQAMDKAALRELFAQELANIQDPQQRLEALRRAHRRELLRIGAAEVLGSKLVVQTGQELADLADVVLETVLDTVCERLVKRYGRPRDERGRPAHFCVVCLGKHGGQELNYNSDIDLLFVYDEDGRAGAVSNHEFFSRLGESLIQALTEVTAEGSLYRVDMRLRPEGEGGPLVRSLRSFWIYYETRGELFERQMLIKARRAAGAVGVWKRFHEMLLPFIFPAHFLVSPQEEIRRLKERIEARILEQPRRDNNLKLRAGGIRDIEFIVQCLQLLNGRVNPRSRSHRTLDAIRRLEEAQALSTAEADGLRRAYTFFRRLENLLQIADGRAVYAVPEEQEGRCCLAWLTGLEDADALTATLERHLSQVRGVYDGVFYGHQPSPADNLDWLLTAEPGSPRAREALEARGFAAGEAAQRCLLELSGEDSMVASARQSFAALLPELVVSLAAAPDPDQGLLRFSRVVAAYGAPATLYRMLHADPNFRRVLIAICGSSRFLAEHLQRDPGLLDGLVSPESDGPAAALAGRQGDLTAVRRYRNQEMLRLGADDLLGLASADETFARLTELAEAVLHMVYREAWRRLVRRHGKPRTRSGREAPFACLAGGKFGGRELDFGSDLDLFFVYEGEGHTGRTGAANSAFFIELAQETIRLLQEGELFKVDARLRPEGRNAPMAISLPALRAYLDQRAATWERLALSRGRAVAGDAGLGRRVLRVIHGFVFGRPVDPACIRQVLEMRQRLEPRPERGRPFPLDLKRGPGGIVDVEFIAQILVLKEGYGNRGLRVTGTRQALLQLLQTGHLEEECGRFLLEAYDRLRQIEKGMRRASEQAVNLLPAGRDLAVLARALGMDEPGGLVREVEQLMRETRRMFLRVFAALEQQLG